MMTLPTPWRYGVALCVLVGGLLSVTLAWAGPAAVPTLRMNQVGVGYDPLSPQEIAEAAAQTGAQPLLETSLQQADLPAARAAGGWTPATHQELLLIERSPEIKGELGPRAWERRADVFTYQYASDTLVHSIYNYATGAVDSAEQFQGFQLPLTAYERSVATGLAFGDANFRQYAERAYAELMARPLVDPEELDTRVFVYYAGAAPEIEPPGMEQCGINRCAQIMVVARDATVLDVLPLVNLSTGEVAFVHPDAQSNAHDHALDDHTDLDHTHDEEAQP